MRTTGLALSILLTAGAASAQVAPGPLEDQPAVRHRVLLRDNRFEVGAVLGTTVGQPFRHTLLAGLKGEYHLIDWLSVGGLIAFGAASFDTGLTEEIDDTVPAVCQGDPGEDCRIRPEEEADWRRALNETSWLAALRGTVTPFAGKLALFSNAYFPYDFYGFGGLGFIQTTNGTDARIENDGLHVGPHFGVGMHVFFTPGLALSLEFADTIISNNPSGRNVDLSLDDSQDCQDDPDECNRVDSDDARAGAYYTFLLGVNAYLPFQAKRSK